MEEELTCIWDIHHRNLGLAAAFALVDLRIKISLAEEAADVTDVDSILVRNVHSSLLEESGSAVRDHAVTLHLTESKTSVSGSTFGWLSGQDLCGASSSGVHLVSDHVLESLIVSWVEEDQDLLFLSSEPIVHHLVAISLVAKVMELLRDLRNLLAAERSGITRCAIERSFLGQNSLNQMPNCHTRWDSMGIDDQVRYDSLLSEGEILLSIGHTASSLLTMPRCKLVTDLRSLDRSSLDFDEQVVGCVIFRDHHLVDDSILGVSRSLRSIFEGLSHSWLTIQGLLGSWLDYLTDNDIISTEFGSRADETIAVELVILTVSQSGSVLRVHVSDPLGLRGSVIVASKKHRSEEASVDSALVYHDRILLIVAGVASDGNDGITARWKLLEMEILHGFGYD